MQWLNNPPLAERTLRCIYCGKSSNFSHFESFHYVGRDFDLFRCPTCQSLMYDPQAILYTIPKPYSEAYKEQTRIGCKYYLETGYSADFIAHCVLATLAGVPPARLKDHLFVDVGAGLGVASYMVRALYDVECVTIEPSYSGELGKEILGIEIQNAYFEQLPAEVLRQLQRKPTLLHLNSVVEHLRDPAGVIRELMDRTEIHAIATVVPDETRIDKTQPFATLLPFLAPGDHLHLPSVAGMKAFFADLGLKYSQVSEMGGLLVAVGSRYPFELPKPDAIESAKVALLERLTEHANSYVARGAAARLLPAAVCGPDKEALEKVRTAATKIYDIETMTKAVADGTWDDIPFNLAVVGYWLGIDAYLRRLFAEGHDWMDLVEKFVLRLQKDYPIYTMEPVEYRWDALLVRAHYLTVEAQELSQQARGLLDSVIAGTDDTVYGPRSEKVQRAREALERLKV